MNIKQPPRSPGAGERALQQALAALQAGQTDQAEWLAAEAVKADPSNPRAQHLLGHARLLRGRTKEAIEALDQAVRRGHDPAAETQLAMALRQTGRDDDALERLNRAVKRKPPFPPAFLELGNLLAALGRVDDAIVVLEEALRIAPRMGELWIQLGFTDHARGDLDKAIERLTRGLATAPNDLDGLFLLARILQSRREFERAVETYRHLLSAAPKDAAAKVGLGICLIELGRNEEALGHLREISRANAKLFGEVVTSLADAGHGRFWLRLSDAARALRG